MIGLKPALDLLYETFNYPDSATDPIQIVRRFKRYGQYAGLAFWLFLTRDWLTEAQP